jgi:transposase
MKKHSFEKRLGLVKKILSGYPVRRLSAETGVDFISLRDWVRVYELFGTEGLHNMSRPNYVPNSEKERMCRLFLEKGVSLRQIYIPNRVSRFALLSWLRKVRKGGYEALYGENGNCDMPLDIEKSVNEILREELRKSQSENLLLRAENALLKKAKALMEEEESRLKAFGRKPSKH